MYNLGNYVSLLAEQGATCSPSNDMLDEADENIEESMLGLRFTGGIHGQAGKERHPPTAPLEHDDFL